MHAFITGGTGFLGANLIEQLIAAGWLPDLWSRFSGREPKITPQKAVLISRRVVASSEKAERELGYRSDIDLDIMLRECRDWLVEQGLLTIDHKEVNR